MSKPGKSKGKKEQPKTLQAPTQDLVVLAADKDIQTTIRTLLTHRTQSLRIRTIQFDALANAEHDPGCLLRGAEILRSYLATHQHAMVIFDRDGCGDETKSREELEQIVETALRQSGWADRAAAIVIQPEFENWVWCWSRQHVEHCLSKPTITGTLHDWLFENGFLADVTTLLPIRPKEALRTVLANRKIQNSSALYAKIVAHGSLEPAKFDPAFRKFCDTLQSWFPVT